MALKIVDIQKDETSYGPVTEPVTLIEAKAWCLVDYTDDDTLLTSLITQSRKATEDFTHTSICPKSILLTAFVDWVEYPPYNYSGISRWDRAFYGFPTLNQDWSELPYGPVSSITSVLNTSNSSTIVLVNNTDYYVRGQAFKQIKIPAECETVLIQYLTPYYCPDALKEAILNEVLFRYENRGSAVNRYAQQAVGYSEGAQALAKQYVRTWL